jgi:hypothetical protein
MLRRAREALVPVVLLAGVALAGCSSMDGVNEASAERFTAEPEPRPAQSIPPKIKRPEKARKLAHKPQRLKHASAIKPRGFDPVMPAEPKPAEPAPARPPADPGAQLRTLWPQAPAAGTFSR